MARGSTPRPGARGSSPSSRCWARCCASSTSIWPAATRASATRIPIHYFTVHAEEWRAAKSWPPVNGSRQFYHRAGPPARGGAAATTARRSRSRPTSRVGSGTQTRYERIAGIDATAYYTDWTRARSASSRASPPSRSTSRLEIAGHPVVSLWLASSEPDAAVFAYLSEVEADGTSRYVTEGVLRAIHRAEARRRATTGRPGRGAPTPARMPGRCRPASRSSCASPCCRRPGASRRQPPQALPRRRRCRTLRAGAAWPAAAAHLAERRRARERAGIADGVTHDNLFRHPERSRRPARAKSRGRRVEGPLLVVAATKQGPSTSLRSGRDDEMKEGGMRCATRSGSSSRD